MKPRRRSCPRSRCPPALNHAADRCAVSAEPEEGEPKFTAPITRARRLGEVACRSIRRSLKPKPMSSPKLILPQALA